MSLQRARIFSTIILLVVCVSCSMPFTSDEREGASGVAFEQVRDNTADYLGRTVMFGGEIIQTFNRENATEIIVLQKPLGWRYRPIDTLRTGGRFLVVSDGFLDPAIYSKGRKITVLGLVKESQRRLIGDLSYEYVIIEEIDHYLWKPGAGSGIKVDLSIGIRKSQ